MSMTAASPCVEVAQALDLGLQEGSPDVGSAG